MSSSFGGSSRMKNEEKEVLLSSKEWKSLAEWLLFIEKYLNLQVSRSLLSY